MKLIPDATLPEILRWILRRRKRFRVTGNSMLPVLKPGDEVLVDVKNFGAGLGDIVVAHHPNPARPKIIKRIAAINPDATVNLKGDNPSESTDYDHFPIEQIVGKVTSRF